MKTTQSSKKHNHLQNWNCASYCFHDITHSHKDKTTHLKLWSTAAFQV